MDGEDGTEITFPIHRVIMCGCSPYLKALFTNEMKETSEVVYKMMKWHFPLYPSTHIWHGLSLPICPSSVGVSVGVAVGICLSLVRQRQPTMSTTERKMCTPHYTANLPFKEFHGTIMIFHINRNSSIAIAIG